MSDADRHEPLAADLAPADLERIRNSSLYNDDLAPVGAADRKWGMWNIAALWVGMSVCIPTYMLASGLIAGGMNWWQAILTVCIGNLIVVVPMILNAHAGTRYGITFPVFARASFGTRGANVAGLLRAIVACGWFGIQTWIGGAALYQLLLLLAPGMAEASPIGFLSTAGGEDGGGAMSVTAPQFGCFLFFWLVNVGLFVWKGMDSIRYVENLGAPLLLLMGLALLAWAYVRADGFGPMLAEPSTFKTSGEFWAAFFPGLTAMVGFWATLSLNIPDFTRHVRRQRDQLVGQVLGLNTTMPLYAFIGVAVTSATVIIFGETIWDPVVLLSRFESKPLLAISMLALALATLTTNMAANIVAPATSFSNLAPRRISMRAGCIATGVVGILVMPWKLLADPSGYIFTWLIGYSALLGPLGGILIADYFIVRKRELRLADLYLHDGCYAYGNGFNGVAMVALLLAILPNVPGFLGTVNLLEVGPFWTSLYHYAWFIGFFLAFTLYVMLMNAGSSHEHEGA